MIVHIAGPDIQVGSHHRQRCSWCGAVLIDEALDRVMVPIGQEGGGRSSWGLSDLVSVEGTFPICYSVIEPDVHEDGSVKLPDGACALLPPELTGRQE